MDESDKMSRLVDELLYISKLESGQISIKKSQINFYNLINDLLISFNPTIERNDIKIVLKIPEDFTITGDETNYLKL